WPFVVVQIIVALYAGLAARAGLFRSFKTAVPAGLGLGVIASLTSTPISYFVFGCTTTGGIALTTALGKALGLAPLGACFFGSFVSDFGDKAVTFALVAAVLHAPARRRSGSSCCCSTTYPRWSGWVSGSPPWSRASCGSSRRSPPTGWWKRWWRAGGAWRWRICSPRPCRPFPS